MDRERPADSLSIKAILASSTSARIKGVKLVDRILGRAAVRLCGRARPTPLPIDGRAIRRVLVLRPGGLGDAVLLIPMLRQLKQLLPHAEIDVFAESRNAAVLNMLEKTVHRCISLDRQPLAVPVMMLTRPYQLVIDTEQWHHATALLACLSGAAIRVGFDTNPARSRCYTVRVPYRQDEFEGRSFLRMLSMLTGRALEADWGQPFLRLPSPLLSTMQQRVRGRRLITIAVRGGIPERCWPPEQLRRTVGELTAEGWDVCLVGTQADQPTAQQIRQGVPHDRILDWTGQLSLPETMAVLACSRVFLGTDSGLMHVAYALGTPRVALFGAGIEAKWAPPSGTHTRVLNRHLPCSPCTVFGYTPKCPIGVQCLREISSDEVLRALHELAGTV